MSPFDLAQHKKQEDELKLQIIDMLIDNHLLRYSIDWETSNHDPDWLRAKISFEVSVPAKIKNGRTPSIGHA